MRQSRQYLLEVTLKEKEAVARSLIEASKQLRVNLPEIPGELVQLHEDKVRKGWRPDHLKLACAG